MPKIYGNLTVTGNIDATGSTGVISDNTPLNNFTAVVDPTATDDDSAGYAVGSVWVNTSSGDVYVLVDASTGAAVWNVDGGASVGNIASETLTAVSNGQTAFTLAIAPPDVNTTSIAYGGLIHVPGTDYTVVGTALTWGGNPATQIGDELVFYYQ